VRTIVFVGILEPWAMKAGVGAPSLYETLCGYARRGWQVHYLTSHKRALLGTAHENDIDVEVPGLTFHRFNLPTPLRTIPRLQAKLDRMLLFPLYAAFALRRLSIAADVLYGYEASGVLAVRVFKLVARTRSFVVSRFQGTVMYAERMLRWSFAIRKLELLLAYRAPAGAFIMTNDGTHGDVVLTRWNRHLDGGNLLHIRNGIDKTLFDTSHRRDEVLGELGLEPNRFYLLAVSRLLESKRVDRSILLMTDLPDAHLIVCGDGEQLAALKQLAARIGVAERVHFLGGISRERVAALMNVCDLFISLYDVSNCGNPLFEALLCGQCIVTLDNGGTGEVIKDRVNGRLLPVESLPLLPGVVRDLMASPDERARLRAGARQWAEREMRTWQERVDFEIDWLSRHMRAEPG
jgi:glycosyltransferase involved in cell wall biosynthesis